MFDSFILAAISFFRLHKNIDTLFLRQVSKKKQQSTVKATVVNEALRKRSDFFEEKSDKLQEELDEERSRCIQLQKDTIMPKDVRQLLERGERQPFPLRFVALAMRHLGNGTHASRVSSNILPTLKFARPKENWTMSHMPKASTLKDWR